MARIRRKLSKNKYLATALITLAIFITGVFLGYMLDEQRVNYLEKSFTDASIDLLSLQLQEQLIGYFDMNENCGIMKELISGVLHNLEKTRADLEDYSKESHKNKHNYENLKRKYMLEEIRFWMVALKAKEVCDFDFVQILYVYGPDDLCGECYEQGFTLNYVKKKFGENVLIFSIDGAYYNEPIISIIKNKYGVTKYPTIIIEDKVFEGYTNFEDIKAEVCSITNFDSIC